MDQIWAIARNFIVEVFRMRVLMILLVTLLLLCTAGIAWWAIGGTATADQKIQTLLSYSLSSIANILSFLTLFVTIASVTRDIKRREIFTITTKPISRGRYLMGKFMGMALLNLWLLVAAGGLTYGLIRFLERTQPVLKDERDQVRELILVARAGIKPSLPDVSAEVDQTIDKLVQQQIQEQNLQSDPVQIKAMRSVARQTLTSRYIMRQRTAPPGEVLVWHFTGIQPVDRKGHVYIRYKQNVSQNPRDDHMIGMWMFGPTDPTVHGGQGRLTRDAVRTVHEFPIPAEEISESGELFVAYRNPVENSQLYPISVIFPLEDGVELLYVAGGFEANFLRAMALIYVRTLFLTVVCLALGSWVTFPVAVLCGLVFFVFGLMSNFIADAVSSEGGQVLNAISQLILFFMPSYAAYDPIPLIEKGRQVVTLSQIGAMLKMFLEGRSLAAESMQQLLILKDTLVVSAAGLGGYLIFRFRELARVIV